MSMHIIGLTGPAGAGKDTVANILCDTHGFTAISLAQPIKQALIAIFGEAYGLTETHFEYRSLKESPLTGLGLSPRHLAQTLGTEWGRMHISPHLWLRIAEARINRRRRLAHTQYIAGIVVTDLRFENEAAWLRHHQAGMVWHIQRPDNPYAVPKHASEMGIAHQGGDIVILNNNDLEHLEASVNAAMEAICATC